MTSHAADKTATQPREGTREEPSLYRALCGRWVPPWAFAAAAECHCQTCRDRYTDASQEGIMDTSKAAAALGRLGGAAGRGASQVRGDSDHYRAIVAKRKDRVKTYEATLNGKPARVTIPED